MQPLFYMLYNTFHATSIPLYSACYIIGLVITSLYQVNTDITPKNWLSKVPQNGSLLHLPLAWIPIKSDHVGMTFWQKFNKGRGNLSLRPWGN